MEKSRKFKIPGTILFLPLFCLSLLAVSCAAQPSIASSQASSPTVTPVACKNWTIVNSPTPGNYYNTLNGVVAISSSDAWAVGSYTNSSDPQHTLTERWNGSAWQVVNSPNPSSTQNAQLFGVAALSTGSVWAVGMYRDKQNAVHTLIEHWNGSSWNIVNSPNPNGSEDQLYSVTVISTSDAWAVGYYSNSQLAQQPLIEHWNGSAWSIVSSATPAGSTGNQLLSVTAVSANNIWAVGSSYSKHGSKTLIEHWNGSQWSIISSPNTQDGNTLMAVTAISGNNIWAVGASYTEYGYPTQSLIEHWNGTAWSIVSSPNVANSKGDNLLSVAAISGNNIWAVGRWDVGNLNYRTLIEHWNGIRWSIVSSPTVVSNPSALQAVTRVPTLNTLWAVGYHFSNNLSAPLIERHW